MSYCEPAHFIIFCTLLLAVPHRWKALMTWVNASVSCPQGSLNGLPRCWVLRYLPLGGLQLSLLVLQGSLNGLPRLSDCQSILRVP